MKRRSMLSRLALSGCAGAVLWLGSCGSSAQASSDLDVRAESPDRFGKLGSFSLTERSGRVVSNGDLAGHAWIASFIFTTCSGPCPTITANLRKLQDRLGSSQVRLVSVSVDPMTDTPSVLKSYADRLGADPARWWFLTGEEAKIYALLRSSLGLSVEHDSGAPIGAQVTHSTRLVVIDAQGAIAGYYSGTDGDGPDRALERALWLETHGG